jgi:hypothetical protein
MPVKRQTTRPTPDPTAPRKGKPRVAIPPPPAVVTGTSGRYTVDRESLILRLFSQGWLAYDSPEQAAAQATDQELRTALLAYQHFHGLEGDGWAGPATQRSLDEPRFCALPDVMPLQQNLCKWAGDNPRVTWNLSGPMPPGLSPAQATDAFAWAWAQWQAVCAIRPEFVADPAAAMVAVTFGPIDRAGGTLAWSELPCGNAGRLTQLFDAQESWVVAENPPRFQMDLGRVACHEIGHVLGMPHLASGNLMQPMYDANIRRPQTGDVAEAEARYGKPKPGTPDPAPTGGRVRLVLEVEGRLVAGELPGFKLVPQGG